jgi:hypothetical protein
MLIKILCVFLHGQVGLRPDHYGFANSGAEHLANAIFHSSY